MQLNPRPYIQYHSIRIETNAHLHNVKSVLPNVLEQNDSFINNFLLFDDTSQDEKDLQKDLMILYFRFKPFLKLA